MQRLKTNINILMFKNINFFLLFTSLCRNIFLKLLWHESNFLFIWLQYRRILVYANRFPILWSIWTKKRWCVLFADTRKLGYSVSLLELGRLILCFWGDHMETTLEISSYLIESKIYVASDLAKRALIVVTKCHVSFHPVRC